MPCGHRENRVNHRPPKRAKARWWAAAGVAGLAVFAAACGSSSPSTSTSSPASKAPSSTTPPASASPSPSATASATALKTAKIGGVTVLTNAKGFTLYSFAPDTATKSACNGACAASWPPGSAGPATACAGVTGKLGTIMRSGGSMQATYNGHPLYTYVGDTAPGQASGNGLNAFGGLWHEVTASGAAPATSKSSSSGGGGY